MKGVSCLSDVTPLTLIDYPGKTAAILWFSLCNLRCRYCYNVSFINGGREKWNMPDILNFLEKRVEFLDGVVFSGGECTLYPALIPMIQRIKELGYCIKLDTNGTSPSVITHIVEEELVDYIALDYKSTKANFAYVTGRRLEYEDFSQTLDFLIERDVDFEVRTTVHPDVVDEEEVNEIGLDLKRRGYRGVLYLQNYFHTENNLKGLKEPSRPFDVSLLKNIIPVGLRNFPEKEQMSVIG